MNFDTKKITSVRKFPPDESMLIKMPDTVSPFEMVTISLDDEILKKIDNMCEDIKSIKEIVRNITYKID